MSNTNYKKGYMFEWRLLKFLEELGWVVLRPGKSGPTDLAVMKKGTILFIECKEGTSRLGEAQKLKEKELADRAGAILVLVTSKNLRKFKKVMKRVSETQATKEALMNALSKFIVS